MDLFDALNLLGGLCLFLFGMNVMGASLEKRAGSSLKTLLSRLTTGKIAGFLTGLGVTSVIQSSSATTVMVVGFVNSGLMTLTQAINVIMGANVGTTVTAWLISLTGIQGDSIFIQMLKPTSFTPILALIGIVLIMGSKSSKKKDTGMILLGFATLMFGMDTMSSAVAGLSDVPEFRNVLIMFSNPILGVLAGAVLTGIIQSSSASVGILQALATTGQVTYGSAIPIIMGQNIGTCVTALLSSIGTNKNARRAAVVHLTFNIIGTVIWLTVFCVLNAVFQFTFVSLPIDQVGIAVIHSVFNILCTALLLPVSGLLEKFSRIVIRDDKVEESRTELDERLMTTPSIAIERCRIVTGEMAEDAVQALESAIRQVKHYKPEEAAEIRALETETDRYEDNLGTYLVKLSTHAMSDQDSNESAKLLHVIGDFERIGDHAVNILESAEEMREKKIAFAEEAGEELHTLMAAVEECLSITLTAFLKDDLELARQVEPLEQVIDVLHNQLRSRQVLRLQHGACTIEEGFVWTDLLTSLERVSDHCSNIAGCVLEMSHSSLGLHEFLNDVRREDPNYGAQYDVYARKYALMK